jgi:hypothetical protein
MCPAFVDPKRVAYSPESLLESQDVNPVAVGGTVFARYHDWPPYYVEIERMTVEHGAQDLSVVVSADGYSRKMTYHARAGPRDTWSGPIADPTKVTVRDTAELMILPETGVADANITARWNMTVRYPTVADKLRLEQATSYPVPMNAAEKAIVEKYNMRNMLKMGMLPRNEDLLGDNVFKWFDEILVVGRQLPDIADGDEWICGGEMKVPYRKCFTLLGIEFDATAAAAIQGIANNELWIKIDRDATNDYMVLDALTMPTDGTSGHATFMSRLFMPALEKMAIRVDNQSGAAVSETDDVTMRFIYGVRSLNVFDHLMWQYPFFDEKDEDAANALNDEFLLTEKIAAGLIDPLQPNQMMNLKLP